jgi:hypothetical protein
LTRTVIARLPSDTTADNPPVAPTGASLVAGIRELISIEREGTVMQQAFADQHRIFGIKNLMIVRKNKNRAGENEYR